MRNEIIFSYVSTLQPNIRRSRYILFTLLNQKKYRMASFYTEQSHFIFEI
jgi:hypothetical protein